MSSFLAPCLHKLSQKRFKFSVCSDIDKYALIDLIHASDLALQVEYDDIPAHGDPSVLIHFSRLDEFDSFDLRLRRTRISQV